jgi:hypothetical protein
MTDTYGLVSKGTLKAIRTIGGRRSLALDSIEAPSEIFEVPEDLSQAPLELRELALEQRDQLMEFAARHQCSLTARSRELQECSMRDIGS